MSVLPKYAELTERGKIIHEELQEVYAQHPEDTSTYTWDVNVYLARDLDEFLDGKGHHYRYTYNEFRNMIWFTHDGGGTADTASDNILNRLGVSFESDTY